MEEILMFTFLKALQILKIQKFQNTLKYIHFLCMNKVKLMLLY